MANDLVTSEAPSDKEVDPADAFMREMRSRFQDSWDAVRTGYNEALEDMKFAFVAGNQWDQWMRKQRAMRPMPEFNKLRQAIRQVIGDQRQNRPGPKIRGVEDGDAELAELRQGLIRNIEAMSRADRAYDNAFEFAVGGGFGCWRIETDYSDEGSFELDIKITEIRNPYSVRFDHAARSFDRRDARFAFIDQTMPVSEYKARWPGKEVVSRDNDLFTPDGDQFWFEEDTVRVAEYWYKEAEEREIVLLSDGRVVNADDVAKLIPAPGVPMPTVVKTRTVTVDVVKHCIVSGAEVLDGPNEWPGKFIPIVPVWGDILNLEGKDTFAGMVRFSKDAQSAYNFERATFMETLAMQPVSPFFATAASVEGFREQYESLASDPPPVLFYNADPTAPNGGKPTREPPPMFPAALAQAAQISSGDIQATSGIYDASLGARSNETSGKAILARQREGDVANFVYIDNLAYAMRYSYEIINDLIPKVFDTERQIRVIGEDGAEKVVRVNQAVFDPMQRKFVTINDLNQGKFDIAVTVGPSYTTQRMETAEAMQGLTQIPGPAGMLAQYAMFKALDTPGTEEVVKALRKLLVGQSLLEPEEGEQPPPPQQPNPKDIADAEKNAAMAKNYNAQAEQTELETALTAHQAGVAAGMAGAPPPVPLGPPSGPPMAGPMPPTHQPPQGGFFMPGPPGAPLQ